MITDDDTVTFAQAFRVKGWSSCGLVLHSRTAGGTVTRQDLPLVDPGSGRGPGCLELDVTNVDSLTLTAQDPYAYSGAGEDDGGVFVATRPAPGAPFTVTTKAPAYAPGLVVRDYAAHRRLDTRLVAAPGLPLAALSSADRWRIDAQS